MGKSSKIKAAIVTFEVLVFNSHEKELLKNTIEAWGENIRSLETEVYL